MVAGRVGRGLFVGLTFLAVGLAGPTGRLALGQALRQPEGVLTSYQPGPQVAGRGTPREVTRLPDVASAPGKEAGTSEVIPSPAGEAKAVAASLTLEYLESLATANNPSLVEAEARVCAAEGRAVQAGLYPNPVAGYKADEIGNEGKAGMQGAFIRQELVTAGKLGLSQSAAEHAVVAARHAADAVRQRVQGDVRRLYYDVLAAQRLEELNRELVRLGDEGVRATTDLLRAKEVSRVDQLQAKIEADAARLRLAQAERRREAGWRELAAMIGLPTLEPAPLAGGLEEALSPLDWEESLRGLLEQSPELAQARAVVQQSRCDLAREMAGRVPNVELEAALQHDFATGDTLTGVQLGMAIPVFDRNQGNICRAEAELRTAIYGVRRVELRLQQRLAAAFERYANARQEAEQYRTSILPNARTSLELVRAGYRQGELGYLALLTAQRTYFQANLAYLEALRQLRAAQTEIEALLLRGGLEELPAPGG